MYDFSRCKLCAANGATPKYKLKKMSIYACPECDFHYIDHLDEMPSSHPGHTAQALDQKGWDYIERHLPGNGQQLGKNLALVKRHLSPAGANCLDIGSGAGLFPHLLAKEGACVQGIEPQGAFREFAQKKFGIELSGETIDASHWQSGFNGFFDAVTLWDVLEHVNFPAETLKNAYNVIKHGGWLFLDTPRRDALYYRLCEFSYRLRAGKSALFEAIYSPMPFRHKQIFTLRQLVQLAKSIGFSVVQVHTRPLQPQNKMVLVCRKP